ncbi:M24 family metallopeptidase [Roseisalinus antarcticus]|uniref:Creatinase n=1 Tax=Roseisalinus antarcticus TaxID=254357 RepID=A0A1Y5SBZ2_9RHOB|nr:M24 family metallopeptidase [Roseisalinus antarcticus]SLN37324.1 Creatinase [Roseisalinus antarcticus]
MTPFPASEFAARTARAQAGMAAAGLSALLLTTEPEIRYYTGFLTRFWESPSRPWFVVVPAEGPPIAVIPAIGAHLMGQSWIRDIRTFAAPAPDESALALLALTLREEVPPGGLIGLPDGAETHVRLPFSDWAVLQDLTLRRRFVGDGGLVARLRQAKSAAEIDRIATACAIAGRAFARVPEIAGAGVPLDQVFRGFQGLCLGEGADWVAYLAGGAGPGGYGDVISPATARPLAPGDVLMLDTGVVHGGYYSDFDRNFSVGPPGAEVAEAHETLIAASRAAKAIAHPGTTHAELFHAMHSLTSGGTPGANTGRIGHGLGMELTEGPSLLPWETASLRPGMVITLEPVIELSPGRIMVHEEVIAIEEDGARWLSNPAPPQIAVLS